MKGGASQAQVLLLDNPILARSQICSKEIRITCQDASMAIPFDILEAPFFRCPKMMGTSVILPPSIQAQKRVSIWKAYP